MKRSLLARLLAVACVAGVLVLVPGSLPAGATIVATSAGTTVTVTATGNETIRFFCDGANLEFNGVPPTPAMACSALTHVIVNGDGGNQNVYGDDLNLPQFSANPHLTTSLGAGADLVTETDQGDSISTGDDTDTVRLVAGGVSNPTVDLGSGGTDTDALVTFLSTGDDTTTVTSGGANVTVATAGGGASLIALDVEQFSLYSGLGDDTVDATGINGASSLGYTALDGGAGDDILTTGTKAITLFGDVGDNILTGSPGIDTFWTSSTTDTINTGGGADVIYDLDSLHSGSRTLTGATPGDRWFSELKGQDVVARIRPTSPAGSALVTASLNRSGQQVLGQTVSEINLNFNYFDETRDNALADVVATGKSVSVNGDTFDDDLLDVTIPTGTWAVSGTPSTSWSVDPSDPAYGPVAAVNLGAVAVHGPWGTLTESFAHRMIRDLLFRFPNGAERTGLSDQLVDHVRTRAQQISEHMATDAYRGLDVDRSFADFLERPPDPGGRTYWIGALRGGRSLRKFRAQLFGSNEYFNKNGATNARFVTAAYAGVLGRAPDPSGAAYWTNKIDTGTGRGVVAEQFLATTEARRAIVTDQFLRFLDRKPTTTETDTWVPILGSHAQGEQELIASLAGSTAYYNRD